MTAITRNVTVDGVCGTCRFWYGPMAADCNDGICMNDDATHRRGRQFPPMANMRKNQRCPHWGDPGVDNL